MKDLKAIKGRTYILGLIAEGEHVQQDFKYAISDARKIARSISAFANNMGGRLLIGVKDNGTIAGVRNEEDIYVVEQAAELYCRPAQKVEFTAFRTGDTGTVIRASIAKSDERPVCAQDDDRSWRAYYRIADNNIRAHPLMVRSWRYAASGRRALLHLDGPDGHLLEALRGGPLPVEKALIASGASRRMAQNAVVRLASLGLIDFIHGPDGFMIAQAVPAD